MVTDREMEASWDRELRALGHAIKLIDRLAEPGRSAGVVLTSIKLKLDADQGTSVLLIATGTNAEGEWVCFVGGIDAATTLLAFKKKAEVAQLKWRESTPWQG